MRVSHERVAKSGYGAWVRRSRRFGGFVEHRGWTLEGEVIRAPHDAYRLGLAV